MTFKHHQFSVVLSFVIIFVARGIDAAPMVNISGLGPQKNYIDSVNVFTSRATTMASSTGCKENQMRYSGKCVDTPFKLTTENDNGTFSFILTAEGDFYVDWGDGEASHIYRTGNSTKEDIITIASGNQTSSQTSTSYKITHRFKEGNGSHTIRFGGRASRYSLQNTESAIRFNFYTEDDDLLAITDKNAEKIVSISGSLGEIFPTLSQTNNGQSQPLFRNTFRGAKITSLPEKLFDGVHGAPISWMFAYTFAGTQIESIPYSLFSGIHGTPKENLFYRTFMGCKNLQEIPEDLFCQSPHNPNTGNCIYGAPANNMFQATFHACSSLTEIPELLFAGIQGAPAPGVFNQTFSLCSDLTNIPMDLFSGIKGAPASHMFYNTFFRCENLRTITDDGNAFSYVPELFLKDIGNGTADLMVEGMFYGTKLDDKCPSGTTLVHIEFEKAGKPWCSGTSGINVKSGQYLPANKVSPDDCKGANKYCPGGIYEQSARDQGIFDCPYGSRQNRDKNACQIAVNANQMMYGKSNDVSKPCWHLTNRQEYKACVFGEKTRNSRNTQ